MKKEPKAGPALDIVIAETFGFEGCDNCGAHGCGCDAVGIGSGSPRYSTNIEDAWLVVAALTANGWPFDVSYDPSSNSPWGALFSPNLYLPDWGVADTAPLAICRAALLAHKQVLKFTKDTERGN